MTDLINKITGCYASADKYYKRVATMANCFVARLNFGGGGNF